VAEPLDVLLPHQLGRAVGADGPGQAGFVLRDAAVLPARKDVVGGDMDQPRAHLFGGLGQIAGAQGVGLVGGVVVHLAAVHVGVGGAVDDDVGLIPADEVVHRFVVGDVQLRQVHRDDGGVQQLFGDGADLAFAFPQLLDDLGAQLPLAACDDDFHSLPLRLRVGNVPAGSVAQLAVGDVLQVLPVGGLAIPRGGLQQLVPADPPILEGDLLGGADLDALPLFDHADKVGGVHQAVHGAGVQPGKAAAQQLDVQLALLEVHIVQSGDLQLAPGRGL